MRAYVGETDLGRIRPGMAAEVTTDSAPGKVYHGQIGFISPVAEFTPKAVETRELRTDLVYRLRVIVDDPDQGLRQGMPVTVALAGAGGADPWHAAHHHRGREQALRRDAAIDGIGAAIAPGCITGLVGPDGAGKSTLLRLMDGLLAPDAGRITVCGFDTRYAKRPRSMPLPATCRSGSGSTRI